MVETQTNNGGTTSNNYYLFYAGSDEGASTYGVGWANCPGGPTVGNCTEESTSGPLLGTAPGMSGPGGPDVYQVPPGSGNYVMAWPRGRAPPSATSAAASGRCTWPA